MEITVQNPTGMRLEAQLGDFTVATDQPAADGGDNSAPSPFDLFLASLATCAGYYVLAFCKQRNLPTEGISVSMRNDWNENKHLAENIRPRYSRTTGATATRNGYCGSSPWCCGVSP